MSSLRTGTDSGDMRTVLLCVAYNVLLALAVALSWAVIGLLAVLIALIGLLGASQFGEHIPRLTYNPHRRHRLRLRMPTMH